MSSLHRTGLHCLLSDVRILHSHQNRPMFDGWGFAAALEASAMPWKHDSCAGHNSMTISGCWNGPSPVILRLWCVIRFYRHLPTFIRSRLKGSEVVIARLVMADSCVKMVHIKILSFRI